MIYHLKILERNAYLIEVHTKTTVELKLQFLPFITGVTVILAPEDFSKC